MKSLIKVNELDTGTEMLINIDNVIRMELSPTVNPANNKVESFVKLLFVDGTAVIVQETLNDLDGLANT
jgi:hypothetical protein